MKTTCPGCGSRLSMVIPKNVIRCPKCAKQFDIRTIRPTTPLMFDVQPTPDLRPAPRERHPPLTKEDVLQANQLIKANDLRGIESFIDLACSDWSFRRRIEWPWSSMPVPNAFSLLEDSLRRAPDKWSDDLLKEALQLRDYSYAQDDHFDMEGGASVAHLHFLARQELRKRGILPEDKKAQVRELIRQIETEHYQQAPIRELGRLGPEAEGGISALVKFYEAHYKECSFADPVIDALEAIGPKAAQMVKHVKAMRSLHTPGNYTVCPCETRMQRIPGFGYKCPNCGKKVRDAPDLRSTMDW